MQRVSPYPLSLTYTFDRTDAGRGVELSESCVDDVGEVEVDDLEEGRACRQTKDNNRYVVLRVALYPSAMKKKCGLVTTGPVSGVSVIFAELSKRHCCWRIHEELTVTNKSNSFTQTLASSFVCTSPLAVKTVVGLLDVVTVPNSAEFKSFFHCSACASTLRSLQRKNSLSSSLISDGARRHQSSIGEKRVDLSFSLSFRIFFGATSTQLCGH